METRREVKTILVNMPCEFCEKGHFISHHNTYQVSPSDGVSFEHKCDSCYEYKTFDQAYPYIEYEEIQDKAKDIAFTFAELEYEILRSKAKSEYKQASIIIIRNAFKTLLKEK